MFSTTTMASSTTNPTEMVSAISERLSRLKPSTYIAAHEPSSASGTVMLGISVAQALRRNSRITITTRPMVSASVNSTSLTEARMVTVAVEDGVYRRVLLQPVLPVGDDTVAFGKSRNNLGLIARARADAQRAHLGSARAGHDPGKQAVRPALDGGRGDRKRLVAGLEQ